MSGCKVSQAPAAAAAPKGNFTGPITVDPVTRIEGHLRIEVEVENGKVKNAWSSPQLFRGLEIILKGRDPRDAQHITQRTCGVCTYVHALTSVRCVDDAVNVDIPANARLIRNLVMGAQYLHDHIVHFYQLHALDWVDAVKALKADPQKAAKIANQAYPRKTTAAGLKDVQKQLQALVDRGQLGIFNNAYFLGGNKAYYLEPELDLIAVSHYLQALKLQIKAARAMAVFGAKNPHTQFTVTGGITNYDALTPERITEFRNLWKETQAFVEEVYLPDVLVIGKQYLDWSDIGGCSNYLTFGEFPKDEKDLESRFLPPGAIFNRDLGGLKRFDPGEIVEDIRHSWYKGESGLHPYKGETDPLYTSLEDKDRYSWMKAPRYQGEAMETGPLASMLIAYAQGHKDVKKAVDYVLNELGAGPAVLHSTLGRTAARCIETYVTGKRMGVWLDQLEENIRSGNNKIYQEWEMPDQAQGVGFSTAPRGALSHWMVIEDKVIKNYQLVVPSTWNLGPRCAGNKLGPVEEALIGTPVFDSSRPVELLRTIHSFDPCIACGVHVIDSRTNQRHKFRVV